jgi:hypothetical protein
MIIEPQAARFSLDPTPTGARASLPARRNWFVVLFLCAWLGGWFFGEVSAGRELLNSSDKTPSGFLGFWLVGWTLGGAYCLVTVLWQLAGREVLIVDGASFIHRLEVVGLGWNRVYRLSDVRNLRSVDYAANMFTNQAAWFPPITGSGYGPIAFDYGARTVRLASSIEAAEADMLVRQMSRYLPRSLESGT